MHIFLVGMPRSGTTVIFEALAARHDVAWFSNYLRRCPGMPAVSALSRLVDLSPKMRWSMGRSDQTKSRLERLGIGPDEAYPVWRRCCGKRFQFDYLLGDQPTPAERDRVRATVAAVRRYQGKPHFAAKLTGPGRIGYLSSIFPDARFVHVLRDGRAVVQSLMKIPFWKQRDRMNRPAWRNGLTERDLADWERHERSPLALAAVQWRRVIESTREEAASQAPDRYAEISCEQFVAEPQRILDGITAFCGLPPSMRADAFVWNRLRIRDMNWQWRERFNGKEIAMLNELMRDLLERLGYNIDTTGSPKGPPGEAMPFRLLPSSASDFQAPGRTGVSRRTRDSSLPGCAR